MKSKSFILLFLWTALQHIEEINTATEDSSGSDVDNVISEYVKEVRRTLKVGLDQHIINKRSHPDIDLNKLTGLELLVGFQEMFSIPSRFPRNLILFSHCLSEQKQWYSAALETKLQHTKDLQDTELVLYKYQGDEWLVTHRVEAAGGRSIAVEQIQDSVYLVVAQYLEDEALGSTVWRLPSASDTLQFVHMLNTHLATHAIMWTDTYTYAAVAISENPAGSEKQYSTLSPVYRWLGNSFDMIDALPTYNPQALVQFNIRSAVFVAVANFQNEFGETMIDSEIFRYDLTSGKFNVYQKLPTEAAVDIKSFCFQSNQITETFLIYASAFHTDERGKKDYNSPSVVYKLSDEEYFMPFQALQVSKVTSWLPVQHVKDGLESLTLIGAGEEGIISFQYDGWRFVPTGLHYDESTFGPGPKSLNVFYSSDQAFISVANTNSGGYDMNVFSPVFKHHPRVEHMQKLISEWVEEMTQEMIEGEAKMIELTRIAREAPSVNDSVIKLGSHAMFRNAEIYELQTIETKVGNSNADVQVYSQLFTLKSQLDTLNQTLAGLPYRIDQTSLHTHTVYEDVVEDSADITCTHSCLVQDLEVTDVNGENLSEFLANVVNTKEVIEFQREISFKELALIEPLNTKTINGHMTESLIDWSEEVIIDYELKVEGDVLANNSILVSETVDGVFLNVVREEDTFEPEVVSPARDIKSLNTSQLMLSDGKLSEVDFRNFVMSTLKTQGDQSFSEFQDIGRIEAEEVTATDLYKAVYPLPTRSQQRSCEDENCSEDSSKPHNDISRARSKSIESINLLDDVIIIPRNFTLYGTVIVENGYLTAKDFVDLKHNVSVEKLSQFSIPLNQSVIKQHFKFKEELKTPMLNVDTLNSLPLSSLVKVEEERGIRLTGRKTFHGALALNGTLQMTGTINGHGLKHLKEDEEYLEQIELDYLNVNEINSSNMRIGPNEWQKRAVMQEDGTVFFKTLNVEENVFANSVMVRGKINNYHLEKLLNDTVFEGDDNFFITGTKHFTGESEILNLDVNPSNSTNFITPESLWRNRLLQAKSIEVDELFYTGKLDGVESRVFGRWLLTEGDQSITASQIATSLEALNIAASPGSTFNSVNITHLLTQAVLVSDNATFDKVIFEEPVSSSEVEVGGRMSGLEVPADIVVVDPDVDQLIVGHKRVLGSVSLAGDLHTSGLVSDVNITAYCKALYSDDSKLIISGNGQFNQEPEILTSVNGIEWPNIRRNIWFKEDNVTILKKVLMNEVDFRKLAVKNINNNNVEDQLSRLVSLSKDQYINGTFYFPNIQAQKGLKAEDATVGGDVQGIQLSLFIKNVLLHGANQEIEGYLDFKRLVIENEFDSLGFINGLNISSDLMFANVASNTVIAELTLDQLNTRTLRLPPGALVAGVDVSRWNRTAVTKSGVKHVITGNVTILGQLDSGQDIRVERSVNGLTFDQNNVMLSNGYQEVTGKKIFSSESDLTIRELNVQGFLNYLNITDFYHQQVTANGEVRISGHKQFTAPLWSERVVLPKIYQDHNLTWLEYQLSAPLPWPSYDGQLANIHESYQLASRCIAGSAYYLKNMTRARDVEGDVLFTMPLKSGNVSALAVVRRETTEEGRLTLSLLHWSDKQNMFMHMPGSVNYFPRQAPSEVQTITLPGGELAAYVTVDLPHNKTSVGLGVLFRLKDGSITQTTVHGGKPGSTLLSFLDTQQRTCFVVVADRCSVHCYADGKPAVRLRPFNCNNITKATLFTTDRGQYILGVQTRLQGSLFLWRKSGKRFTLVLELPQFNPVSIAATTTTGPLVAVANLHRLGHSRPETVNIFRLDENTSQLQLQQSLPAVSPSLVVFSSLPSSESVLYVASLVPASPLWVYVYRGILGYQLLTSDSTLPVPSDLQPFTDHQRRHFLVVPSNRSASVLRAEFEGMG